MRRRRNNGKWLTNIGTTGADLGEANYRSAALEFQLGTIFAGGTAVDETNTFVTALTFDRTFVPEQAGGQYDQFGVQGQAYFLKRIVGKFSAMSFSDADAGAPAFIKVGAAFFVAKQSESLTTIDTNNQPQGHTAVGGPYDPLSAQTIADPWIWRRTWILPNVGQTAADRWTGGPVSNTAFGSVLDGGHIDAKTKRVVKPDERLWFCCGVHAWPFNPANRNYTYGAISAFIVGDLDYRIFASPIARPRRDGSF